MYVGTGKHIVECKLAIIFILFISVTVSVCFECLNEPSHEDVSL